MKTESEANFSQADQPAAETAVKPSKNSKPAEKKTSPMNRVLKKAGYALLFFFLGALVVGLVLYLPTRSDLNAAQSELDRLVPMEAVFEETSKKAAIYKILNDVSNLQIALTENDANRASQYTKYIEDDLAELSIGNLAEIPPSLSSQFAALATRINSDPEAALNSLQDFRTDLLSLIDNL